MGYFSCLKHAIQIEGRKFLPFGQNQQCVCILGRLVRIAHKLGLRVQYFTRAVHGGRIIGGDLAAFLQQRLHQKDGGRFADVVGATFKGQPQNSQTLSAQRP